MTGHVDQKTGASAVATAEPNTTIHLPHCYHALTIDQKQYSTIYAIQQDKAITSNKTIRLTAISLYLKAGRTDGHRMTAAMMHLLFSALTGLTHPRTSAHPHTVKPAMIPLLFHPHGRTDGQRSDHKRQHLS